MRWLGIIALCSSVGLSSTAAAQTPGGGWALHVGLTRESFSGASADTTTIPGTEVEVVPAPRLGLEVGLGRKVRGWEVSLGVGFAGGGLRAQTNDLTLEDRTGAADRYRAVLRVGRELLRLEAARLILEGGVALDHWRVDGIGSQSTAAGLAGVRLRVPLGSGIALENSALFAVGESPFGKSALPPEATTSSIRTWSLGFGLRRGW